jgi:hypothetical protein
LFIKGDLADFGAPPIAHDLGASAFLKSEAAAGSEEDEGL